MRSIYAAWERSDFSSAGAPAVDSAAIRAGLRAGSWAPACMVTPGRIGGLPSPDAQWRGHRDRQLAGRAGCRTGAPAVAGFATGSRSMDPASDQTDGSAAAMLAVPGRLRLGGARRGHPHAADPHPVVRPSRSIGLPGSAAGDAPIITRPPAAHGTCAPPRSRPAQLLERREHILGELRGPLDRARRMSGARLASRRFRPCRRATLRRAPARHLSGSVTMALVNDGVASQPTL